MKATSRLSLNVVSPKAYERQRILVVDDDAYLLRALYRVLAAHADVDVASGVAGATAKLLGTTYDVVLTDDKMADGSGQILLEFVRKLQPECRRILMSGDDVPAKRNPDPPYDSFLRKPFDGPQLIDVLTL